MELVVVRRRREGGNEGAVNGVEMVARASSLRISGKLFGKGGGKGRMTV